MNELWFFLPGIIYLGLVTSYTDIKYGKIKNRDVVIGIAYALAAYLGLTIYFLFYGSVNYRYLMELGTNAVFALAVAFGLWEYKIWSAGDGKLFFAFALLVPLGVYQFGRYSWIPSITILFNVFIIGLLAMVLLIIKNARVADYKKMTGLFFRKRLQPKQFLNSIVSLFATFWLVQIALSYIGLGSSKLLMYVFTIAVFSLAPKFLNGKSKKQNKMLVLSAKSIPFLIAALRLAIDKSVYSISFLWSFLVLVFFWRVSREFLRGGAVSLGKEIFSKNVRVSSLKPGMMLSDQIFKIKKLKKKEAKKLISQGAKIIDKGRFSYISGAAIPLATSIIDSESEGIEKRHIRKIRNIGFKTVKISSTLPFSPFMFFGVLATIAGKGNILILLNFLLN